MRDTFTQTCLVFEKKKKKIACSCCPKILVDLKICNLISLVSLKF
jgi:hypothetical protein